MRDSSPFVICLCLIALLLVGCSAATPPTGIPTAAVAPTQMPTSLPEPTYTARPPTEAPPATATSAPATLVPVPGPPRLRVAYSRDGNIMLWTEGEAPRALAVATPERIALSADGLVVVYLGSNAQGVRGIYALDAGGGKERLLASQDALQQDGRGGTLVDLGLAPDSHMVYFVTDQYDLYRVQADGGDAQRLFGPGEGGFFSFSPDGQWLALYHPNELVLARADGSQPRVAFGYPEDFSYTMMGPQLVWEKDASGFYLASATGPQGEPGAMTLWFVPISGQPVARFSWAGPYGAEISPDGQKVAYLFFQHDPVDVHLVAAQGEDTLFGAYASQSAVNLQFLGWAPDARRFLLNLSEDGRIIVPYLCAPGEEPVKLTDTVGAQPVVWVDEQRVLYASHGDPQGGALRLQNIGQPSVAIDAIHSAEFAYALVRP